MTPPDDASEGGAWISSGQIYQELRRLAQEVAGLRAELRRAEDHETRIRALERRVWGALGGGAVLGAVAGQAPQILGG